MRWTLSCFILYWALTGLLLLPPPEVTPQQLVLLTIQELGEVKI